jgi:hypothetical protein
MLDKDNYFSGSISFIHGLKIDEWDRKTVRRLTKGIFAIPYDTSREDIKKYLELYKERRGYLADVHSGLSEVSAPEL